MILLAVLAAVLFMLIGVPVFIVICGLAVYLFFISGIDLSAIIIEMHRMATTPVLVAIPLFTFSGYLLSESGAPKRLIRLSNAVLGWLPGGLAVIALICCAIFTALSGATGLTIIALGGILLPAMTRGKYPEVFSLGLLTTSGTLGLLEESSDEMAGGFVWYIREQNAKLTLDVTRVNGVPVSSDRLDLLPGDAGWLLRTQLQVAF